MNRIICWIVMLFVTHTTLHAQSAKFQYGGMQHFSLSNTDISTFPGVNFINGVRYQNRFFAGIGFSFNFVNPYNNLFFLTTRYRSIPLYLDGRYYMGNKRSLFILADLGLNPTYLRSSEWDNNTGNKGYAGYYSNIGAGAKGRLGREVFYTVDIAYNMSRASFDWMTTNQIGQPSKTHYQILSQMLIIRMGLEL